MEREQEQLARRQQEEAARDHRGATESQEKVAQAWRDAQREAESKRQQRARARARESSSMHHHASRPPGDAPGYSEGREEKPLATTALPGPFEGVRRLTPEAIERRAAPIRTEVTSQLEQVRGPQRPWRGEASPAAPLVESGVRGPCRIGTACGDGAFQGDQGAAGVGGMERVERAAGVGPSGRSVRRG